MNPPDFERAQKYALERLEQGLPAVEILADADLDLLGRDDCWLLNRALRAEMAALGQPMTDEEWYGSQLALLQAHRYFTTSARTLRQELKQRHIEELAALLEESRR